ncbi:STAS/SEC14 domain-containing protein [Caenimonas terrae]|uniref:STAS/SEC14 domain-containing protein n=1 Tax=Caenimonas terrae TaxID=696074 RepID=A0ABW0NBQ7_9BURK
MPFEVTVDRHPDYVRYNVAGPTSLREFAELTLLVAGDVDRYEDDRVLIDLRRVEGRLTRQEQTLIGELGAGKLQLLFKLASIVPPGEITRNTEQAAVAVGLQMRVFDAEPEALAWLLDGQPG